MAHLLELKNVTKVYSRGLLSEDRDHGAGRYLADAGK